MIEQDMKNFAFDIETTDAREGMMIRFRGVRYRLRYIPTRNLWRVEDSEGNILKNLGRRDNWYNALRDAMEHLRVGEPLHRMLRARRAREEQEMRRLKIERAEREQAAA